jgi:hypothetical protein
MKKVLIRSLITALVINTTGSIINLVSYFVNGKFLLSQALNGGECIQSYGFGLILTKIIPIDPVHDPDAYRTAISLHPSSFIFTIVVCFIPSFVIFSIIYLIGRKKLIGGGRIL